MEELIKSEFKRLAKKYNLKMDDVVENIKNGKIEKAIKSIFTKKEGK